MTHTKEAPVRLQEQSIRYAEGKGKGRKGSGSKAVTGLMCHSQDLGP
jgi:hypothetical protein